MDRNVAVSAPRVLLADDHRLMLEGLQRLLAGSSEIVGTAEDGRAAVQAAKALRPDVALLDITMPVMNGLEAARQLRSLLPQLKIVFLTMHSDPAYAIEAFHSGASGYVLKRSASSELIEAIEVVLQGKPYVTPTVIKDMLNPVTSGSVSGLSPEDLEIARLMAHGSSATDIADALNVSVRAAVSGIARIVEILDLPHME